jgi:hypothetical protein
MNRTLSNFVFIIMIILLTSCNNGNKPDQNKNTSTTKSVANNAILKDNEDSIKLTDLVKRLYKWHISDSNCGCSFNPLKNNPSDTLYSSIDLVDNNKAINKLKQTGLFAEDFLTDYRKIAVRMDKELRDGSSLWPDGELSTFGDDADAWCSCQDSPVNDYWKIIKLTDIKLNQDEASFKWTWGDNFFYKVKAKKENGNWKISYLQGFDMDAYSWEWWKKHKDDKNLKSH